jgi:Glycosyl transferases group 1
MLDRTFRILLPSLQPVGGIQKCFDYANHADWLGYRTIFHVAQMPQAGDAIFGRDDFVQWRDRRSDVFSSGTVPYYSQDIYFFSLPSDFARLEPLVAFGLCPRQIVHIIQNVRHATPAFQDGYAIRLLSRPITRIAINNIVKSAITPHLHPKAICETILLGHPCNYFAGVARPERPATPIRVGYMSWKSDIGDRVAHHLAIDARFAFCSLRDAVGWPALREFYAEIDVLLCAPNPEEGFYLPGLEAMAAGCLVVTPNVGGNMVYCQFDQNCLPYPLDDAEAAAQALIRIAEAPTEILMGLREAGLETVQKFSLDEERKQFGELLTRILEPPAGTAE